VTGVEVTTGNYYTAGRNARLSVSLVQIASRAITNFTPILP